MDMLDKVVDYAPILIVVLIFFIQYQIFVRPEQLEIKHRNILQDIDTKYASKETVNKLDTELRKMSEKIDKIYEILIK